MKEAAHQLNYNDDAVLHLIKAIMPSEIYGTLYHQNDLNTLITMVKDIYAKKPEPVSLLTATAAPFTIMKAPNGSRKQTHFHDGESLSERVDRLSKTPYLIYMEGKHTKNPTNPTSLDVEEAEMDPGHENVTLEATTEKDGPGQKKKIQRRKRRIFPQRKIPRKKSQ